MKTYRFASLIILRTKWFSKNKLTICHSGFHRFLLEYRNLIGAIDTGIVKNTPHQQDGGQAKRYDIKIRKPIHNLYICSLVLLLFCSSMVIPQSAKVNYNIWSIGTAYNLPQGRWEVGLFHPLRYGLSERIELAAHPILFFVMPNISLKWSHNQTDDFAIATRHSLTYPTPLLRLSSMEGAGGIISPEFYIPHMVEFYNEFLFSKNISDYHLITGKVGFSLAAKSDELDERALIDYPMAYHRLAVYYHGYGLRFGVDMQGLIIGKFNYLIDGDIFYIPGVDYNFSFENKGMIHWRFSDYSELAFGYKLIYGEYPYGNEWNLFLPMIDFQLAWD